MNNLKLLGLTAGVGSLVLAGSASADFLGFDIDEIDSGLGIGTTYRIYAVVDAGGEVDAVYGDDVNALSIQATTSFYQNGFGGYGTPSAALFGFFPSLEYDSFVTIGLLDDAGDAMLDIGIDFTNFEAGGAIWTDNGTWFATPNEAQVQADADGRVLIGQFTSDGDVSGTLSLQGKEEDTSINWNANGVQFDTAPAPGALALLGLAGLASRRRRK
jgi:MYXO-CTERM domain-containing protein